MKPDNAQLDLSDRRSYYLAGLGACAMGLASLGYVMTEGRFALMALALLTLGYCISWRIRSGKLSVHAVDAVTLLTLLSGLCMVFIVPGFREILFPAQALETTDLTMAVILAWLMVACSFRLTSDVAVVFLCVPSLSLVGLAATFEPGTEVMTYFVIFLALACFILVRENVFLHRDRVDGRGGIVTVSASSMKVQLGVTASIVLAALVVGIGLGTMLYPALVRAVSPQIAPFSVAQTSDTFQAEEYVPVATGPVNLSDQEVMVVRCSTPLLWRGRTFNRYDGEGWSSSIVFADTERIKPFERTVTPDAIRDVRKFAIPAPTDVGPRRLTYLVEQTFTVTGGAAEHTVYAAAEPKTITFAATEPAIRISNRIEAEMALGCGLAYTVVSSVSRATPRDLSTASTEYPPEIVMRYMGVPETCWQVQKLTDRVTSGLRDPYSKANAIQSYLESNYSYDTNAPRAPEHEDAITHFLYRSRRGYCDIFSSAMVIMARQAGIPARWATGYATGEYDSSDKSFHVQAKDRHAWAELYFPGYGWIPFDATPAGERITWADRLRSLRAMLKTDRQTLLATILVIALAAYLFKTELVDRFRQRRGGERGKETPASREVTILYHRMCAVLARSGVPRHPSATPWEYSQHVTSVFAPHLTPVAAVVDTITSDFVEFRYSARQAPPEMIVGMTNSIRVLARSLKDAKRKKQLPKT